MSAPSITYYVESTGRNGGPFDSMSDARAYALALSTALTYPRDSLIIKRTTQVVKKFTVQDRPAPVET